MIPLTDFTLISLALEDTVKVFAYYFPESFINIRAMETVLYEDAANLIMRELQRQSIKVNIVLTLNFYMAAEPDVETVPAIFFRRNVN